MRSIWARLGIAMATAVLVGSYQNCGQSVPPQQAGETEEDYLVRAMEQAPNTDDERAITSEKSIAASGCKAENLRCIRKIYSPHLQDRSGKESMCLDGSELCLDVQSHTYDTRNALSLCEDCGAEAAKVGGEYNREEVTCWLGEPGQPSARVFAMRSNLEDAVSAALDACGGE